MLERGSGPLCGGGTHELPAPSPQLGPPRGQPGLGLLTTHPPSPSQSPSLEGQEVPARGGCATVGAGAVTLRLCLGQRLSFPICELGGRVCRSTNSSKCSHVVITVGG